MFESVVNALVDRLAVAIQYGVASGVFRNLLGYAENIAEDGKVTKYELKQLLSTTVRYIQYVFLASFLVNPEAGVGVAFVMDFLKNKLKPKKK